MSESIQCHSLDAVISRDDSTAIVRDVRKDIEEQLVREWRRGCVGQLNISTELLSAEFDNPVWLGVHEQMCATDNSCVGVEASS